MFLFFDSNWLHLYSLDLSTELIFTNPHRFIFFQNVDYQNLSALHFLTKSFQISFQCFHCHRIFNKYSTANYFLTCRLNNQSWIKSICNYQIAKVEISIKSKSNVFVISEFFNKSSAANYFLTSQLNNQFWIRSICNYQIAKDENSIKSKSANFFIFKFYHWQLRHQEQQLIYSPFFKNHTNFYFVRLTLRLAALASRASCVEYHPSVSYTVC